MHYFNLLYPALVAAATLPSATSALRSGSAPKVKLSNVQSLTLRQGLPTSHRRVSSIPQLKCIGGSGSGLYEIDTMRCKNAGSDYDEEAIQWTCTASLPEEFKLGSTDVICEGYDYPDDPYILKGSCGVEYRLVLTDKGHGKFGKGKSGGGWFGGDEDDMGRERTFGDKVVAAVFWMIFIGVAAWILFNIVMRWTTGLGAAGAGAGRPGWGGGGGGGGWGGNNDDHDPPPPYDWDPTNTGSPRNKRSYGGTGNESWRPGFWSGAAAGGAAAYAAGRQWGGGNRQNNTTGTGSGWGSGRWNNGEGSSRSSSGSSSSPPSFSSTRHESTGFGSTSRR